MRATRPVMLCEPVPFCDPDGRSWRQNMLRYKCAHCGEKLESPAQLAGQEDMCPACGKLCTVPQGGWNNRSVRLAIGGSILALALGSLLGWLLWPRDRHSTGSATEPEPGSIVAPAGVVLVSIEKGPGREWVGERFEDGKTSSIFENKKASRPEYESWWRVETQISLGKADSRGWRLLASRCKLVLGNNPSKSYPCLGFVDPRVCRAGENHWWPFEPRRPTNDDVIVRYGSHGPSEREGIGQRVFSTYKLPRQHSGMPMGTSTIAEHIYQEIVLKPIRTGDRVSLDLAFGSDTPMGQSLRLVIEGDPAVHPEEGTRAETPSD
ncbi:MAG: hypothetical protein BWX88_01523 [Planctomycetes bacterium ADurb.Bin126]|nr:MAG: hypothetical protein BWX88_01523 [Planctomycetes bacterium ADurb.Bin126]